MLFKTSAVLLVLLSIFFTASAAPRPETNAERMARGLPPNPPKKFSKRMQGPTRVGRAVPSSVPPVTWNGRIDVRDIYGIIIGRIRYQDTAGGLTWSLNQGDDLEVEITAPKPQTVPTDIRVTNHNFPAPGFLGAAGSLPGRLEFTNVIQTLANSPPVASGGIVVESAIWTLNPDGFALTSRYVNPDSTTLALTIAYDKEFVFFVDDLQAYNVNRTVPAAEVKLTLTCEGDD